MSTARLKEMLLQNDMFLEHQYRMGWAGRQGLKQINTSHCAADRTLQHQLTLWSNTPNTADLLISQNRPLVYSKSKTHDDWSVFHTKEDRICSINLIANYCSQSWDKDRNDCNVDTPCWWIFFHAWGEINNLSGQRMFPHRNRRFLPCFIN